VYELGSSFSTLSSIQPSSLIPTDLLETKDALEAQYTKGPFELAGYPRICYLTCSWRYMVEMGDWAMGLEHSIQCLTDMFRKIPYDYSMLKNLPV
jgi:hypothetical protein